METFYYAVPLLLGALTALVAYRKGRRVFPWFVAGLLLSVIGLILVLVLPGVKGVAEERAALRAERRRLRRELKGARLRPDRPKWTWVYALGAVASLVLASTLQKPMDRVRFTLVPRTQAYEGLPPELVITSTMLAGMKGLLIDVLWIRKSTLKQEGRFFEMVQLYDWIGKLEPRFQDVWVFGMWDLAYNVSVELPPGKDRWRWVRSGLGFGQTGLRYNPKSEKICHQMSWIYWHKIGQTSDDSHKLYKIELFREMRRLVGDSTIAEIARLAEAVGKGDEWLARDGVREIVAALKARGVDLREQFSDIVLAPEHLPQEATEYLQDEELQASPAMEELMRYLRGRVLQANYVMEPGEMVLLMANYGPLDWRTPFPHAMYWATKAIGYAEQHGVEFKVNFDRIIYFCMQDLCATGRYDVSESEDGALLITGPDYRFAERNHKLLQYMLMKYGGAGSVGIRSAHSNFLKRMVFDMELMGNRKKALWWFGEYKKFYKPNLKQTYNEFLERELPRWLVHEIDPDRAKQGIMGLLHQYFYLTAAGDDDQAALALQRANFLYDWCRKEYKDHGDRMRLEPRKELRKRILWDIFSGRARWDRVLVGRLRKILGKEAEDIEKEIRALIEKQRQEIEKRKRQAAKRTAA